MSCSIKTGSLGSGGDFPYKLVLTDSAGINPSATQYLTFTKALPPSDGYYLCIVRDADSTTSGLICSSLPVYIPVNGGGNVSLSSIPGIFSDTNTYNTATWYIDTRRGQIQIVDTSYRFVVGHTYILEIYLIT